MCSELWLRNKDVPSSVPRSDVPRNICVGGLLRYYTAASAALSAGLDVASKTQHFYREDGKGSPGSAYKRRV
jgi:hypothetical protein